MLDKNDINFLMNVLLNSIINSRNQDYKYKLKKLFAKLNNMKGY